MPVSIPFPQRGERAPFKLDNESNTHAGRTSPAKEDAAQRRCKVAVWSVEAYKRERTTISIYVYVFSIIIFGGYAKVTKCTACRPTRVFAQLLSAQVSHRVRSA